jgi:diaminopimelate dehydrogenase
MTRQRLVIIGFGRLGLACAQATRENPDVELAGVVRRPASRGRLPAPFSAIPVAVHVRDLARVDAALLCVPPPVASGIACEILQMRVALVECAMLEGPAAQAHYAAIASAAGNHRVSAVVGAGWNPGILPLLQHAFAMLVPNGETSITARPAVGLHHCEAVRNIEGVRDALAAEYRDAENRLTRYVYAELEEGIDPARVQARLDADPLFAEARSLLFPVEKVARLREEGHGILVERRGTAHSGGHQNIVFEARFEPASFAARVMLDAARRLAQLKPGAHRYSLWAG